VSSSFATNSLLYLSLFPVAERSHKTRGQRSAPEPFHVEHGANATDDVALSAFSSTVCRATTCDAASNTNTVRDAADHGRSRDAMETAYRCCGERQQQFDGG